MELSNKPNKMITVNLMKTYSLDKMALFILTQDWEEMQSDYLEALIKVKKKEFNL